MFKYILAALIAISIGGTETAALAISPKEAADTLGQSVVAVVDGSKTICTASKIGDHQYITAKHCVKGDFHFYTPNEKHLYWKSVLESVQKKDTKRSEDWAIVNTIEEDDKLKPLSLSCSEKPYLTQEIAYAGFPYPTNYVVATGRVTSLKPMVTGPWNLDTTMDVHAAPGASGSPVLSLDSGKIVGILVEMVVADRAGAYMYGFENISNVDACDTLKEPVAVTQVPSGKIDEK